MEMRRVRVLSAIAAILGSAAAAGGWQAPSALSSALRSHLQNEQLAIVTSIRGLPLGVREQLQALFGSPSLDIAEPGAEYQGPGAAANRQLPLRRLAAAGCSRDFHCLVYYERGGAARTWHVLLFHWTPAATRVEWGGTAPGGLKTIEEVRKAVVSGAAKGYRGPW
jgi:hypothetical protein